MKILHVDASASDAETSRSRRLSAALVAGLAARDGASIIRRDVAADRLPHVDTTIRQAWTAEGQEDPTLAETGGRSRDLLGELKSVDVVVIGSPMYDFTVPSTLKAWIDHVAIAGQTFRFTDKGSEELLGGKKAYLALSSGGIYSEGPAAGNEHLDSDLRAILTFIGIADIETVRAEGAAFGPVQDNAAMEEAYRRIDALVATT